MNVILGFQQRYSGQFLHDVFLGSVMAESFGDGARILEGYAVSSDRQIITCLVEFEGQLYVPWSYTTGYQALPSLSKVADVPLVDPPTSKMLLFQRYMKHALSDRKAFILDYYTNR